MLHHLPEYTRLSDGHLVRAGRVVAVRGGRMELSTKRLGVSPSSGQGFPRVAAQLVLPAPSIGEWAVIDSRGITIVPEHEFSLSYALVRERSAA